MPSGQPSGQALTATAGEPKPLLVPVRRWLQVDVIVLAAAGVQCFVLATQTDRWFAWTVSPPVSAAVLGAGYLGSIVMVLGAGRARRWVDARVVIISTLVFASLTLLVTLLHLDKFHFDDGGAAARAAAVAWLVIYVVVPPLVLWLVMQQRRAPGVEPERAPPLLAGPARACLLVEGCLLMALGLVMFGGATWVEFWPWTLTDLTARAIAPWLVALATMLVLCAWEAESARTRSALHAVAASAVLWIVALLRFRGSVEWDIAGVMTVAVPAVLIVTVAVALASAEPARDRAPGRGDAPGHRDVHEQPGEVAPQQE